MDFTILGLTLTILKIFTAVVLAILVVGIAVLAIVYVIAGISVLCEKETDYYFNRWNNEQTFRTGNIEK